jgi:hypothetical protein
MKRHYRLARFSPSIRGRKRGSRQGKGKATFCEQKVAKKLYFAGPWAVSETTPTTQHNRSFLRRFFSKKRRFS